MISLVTSLSVFVDQFAQPAIVMNFLLKASVILALAGSVNAVLSNSSAAVRHWVWSLAFYSLLIMPFVSQLVPKWNLAWLPKATLQSESLHTSNLVGTLPPVKQTPDVTGSKTQLAGESPVETSVATEPGAAKTGHPTLPEAHNASAPAAVSGQAIPWFSGLVALWVAGSVLLLGRLAAELVHIWWLVRRGARKDDPAWQQLLHLCQARLNVQRSVQLIFSEQITIPITFGLMRSVILLPQSAHSWSRQKREIVLLHELAHIRRWDYVSNLSALFVCALYWPNPLVWIAERRLRIERERACDDAVILQGAERCEYASYLLDLAKSLPEGRRVHSKAIAIAHNSELKNRLCYILEKSIKRAWMPRRFGMVSAITVISLLLPLAALRLQPNAAASDDLLERPIVSDFEALLGDLKTGSPTVKERAAWSLGEREDRRAVQPLMSVLKDPDPDVRAMAAWALGEIKDRRALRPLLDALTDPDVHAREMVVRAVGELEDRRAVQPLIGVLKDPQPDVKIAALWALGELGDKQSFYAVVSMLEDPSIDVKNATLWALRGIGCDPAFVAVTASLTHPEPSVRETAAKVLAQFVHKATDKALPEVLQEYSPYGHESLRRYVPEIKHCSAVSHLIDGLRDSDAGVRAAVAETLGKIGNPKAVEALITATKDRDPSVRAMAVWALDEINLP